MVPTSIDFISCRHDETVSIVPDTFAWIRFRTKRAQLERVEDIVPESQGQNLALKVSCVPYALASGSGNEREVAW